MRKVLFFVRCPTLIREVDCSLDISYYPDIPGPTAARCTTLQPSCVVWLLERRLSRRHVQRPRATNPSAARKLPGGKTSERRGVGLEKCFLITFAVGRWACLTRPKHSACLPCDRSDSTGPPRSRHPAGRSGGAVRVGHRIKEKNVPAAIP